MSVCKVFILFYLIWPVNTVAIIPYLLNRKIHRARIRRRSHIVQQFKVFLIKRKVVLLCITSNTKIHKLQHYRKRMTFLKCPKCGYNSIKQFSDSQVVGLTKCVKGDKVLMIRRKNGYRCMLCTYEKSALEMTNSRDHRSSINKNDKIVEL
jgi:predicted RNA-binding Zn-ribbon protein involved in translation (DUF1610 family)